MVKNLRKNSDLTSLSNPVVYYGDRATIDSKPLDSFTILTTSANSFMSSIHKRMPVIPEQSDAANWIHCNANEQRNMIDPYPGDDPHSWEVGPEVGKVSNQGESLIREIEP